MAINGKPRRNSSVIKVFNHPDVDQANYLRDIQSEIYRERIAELELSLEDNGWINLTDATESWEFSRDALRRICRMSRLFFLKNPIINRGVTIQAIYVWGQGVKISARNEDITAIVHRFLEDAGNKTELISHRARVLKECDLQVDGNIFFALFTDKDDGSVSVRTIPVDELNQIVHNPDDRKEPWFYKRTHDKTDLKSQLHPSTGGQEVIYYPDWNLDTEEHVFPEQEAGINQGSTVSYERDVKIFHVKVGSLSEMQFGVPETYQALDWARAYKEFLEDWATIVKSLSTFAWKAKGPSSSAAMAAVNSALGSTLSTDNPESNPRAPTGSVWYEDENVTLDPIKVSGATVKADDGRRLLLMALMSMGIPENFTGDVSIGTLATAESMDRPTELKFKDRQTLWTDIYSELFQYVIRQAAIAGYRGLKLQQVTTEQNEKVWQVFKDGQKIDTYVDVTFPPILERDIEKIVRSVVTAYTLSGNLPADPAVIPAKEVSRKLLQAVGVEDIDGVLKMLYADGENNAD